MNIELRELCKIRKENLYTIKLIDTQIINQMKNTKNKYSKLHTTECLSWSENNKDFISTKDKYHVIKISTENFGITHLPDFNKPMKILSTYIKDNVVVINYFQNNKYTYIIEL